MNINNHFYITKNWIGCHLCCVTRNFLNWFKIAGWYWETNMLRDSNQRLFSQSR